MVLVLFEAVKKAVECFIEKHLFERKKVQSDQMRSPMAFVTCHTTELSKKSPTI